MSDEKNIFGEGEFGGSFGASIRTDAHRVISDIMTMTGISDTNARYRKVVLAFLNESYLTILKGRHWKFLNKELYRETLPPLSGGGLDVKGGIHIVKHTNDLLDNKQIITPGFNSNYVGQLIQLGRSNDVYRIIRVPSREELELGSGVASDNETNVGFHIYNDRIVLDSKVQAIRSLSVLGFGEIKPCGLQEFRTRKSYNPSLAGSPNMFTIFTNDAQDGSMTLELYPNPDKRYSLHIEYTERVMNLEDSETCYLAIPPEHLDVITLAVRAKVYQDQNNIPLAQLVGSKATTAWNRMAGDQEMTDSKAKLKPGRKYFRGRTYSGYYGLKHFGKVDD